MNQHTAIPSRGVSAVSGTQGSGFMDMPSMFTRDSAAYANAIQGMGSVQITNTFRRPEQPFLPGNNLSLMHGQYFTKENSNGGYPVALGRSATAMQAPRW